jgi:hypothetical protein
MSLTSLLLAHAAVLGAFTTPRNTAYTGDAWALLPSNTDDVAAADQRFAVAVHLKQTGAGTVRSVVVTSHDGVTWAVAAASTVLSQDGAEIFEVLETTRLLRFVAVVTVLTGNTLPNHTLSASLMSNGRFNVNKVSKTVSTALAKVDASVETSTRNGHATIPNGQSQVDVVFQTPWQNTAYTVVATPEGEAVASWVSTRTATGFRLQVSGPVGQDTTVHWMAVHD